MSGAAHFALLFSAFCQIRSCPTTSVSLPRTCRNVTAASSSLGRPADVRNALFGGPQNDRQRAVVAAFRHGWDGYKRHAWGRDRLRPVSRSGEDWLGLGFTVVDSLDTMLVMDLQEEFAMAREWVDQCLIFTKDDYVNFFETTIRVLGGLLSAFHLSGDSVFLEKAKDLGNRLLAAFSTPSGFPYYDVNLKYGLGRLPKWGPLSGTSEVTSVQLEFRDLSRITGDTSYEDAADIVSRTVHTHPKADGLVPIYISAETGHFTWDSRWSLGAGGDSYYEYLIKQWVQTGKTVDYLREDFVEAMHGVRKRLAGRTRPGGLLYIGERLARGPVVPKMDELVCFLPGSIALGVQADCGLDKAKFMKFAHELAYTCYLTYARQPTHLSADITYFNSDGGSTEDFHVRPNCTEHKLRPETVESLWYLYYFTGNRTYQDWGWEIFQAIQNHTRMPDGYTTIGNVLNASDVQPKDVMPSYLLGETFKYLYLLFADRQEVDLEKWVLNTEAHLLPIRTH